MYGVDGDPARDFLGEIVHVDLMAICGDLGQLCSNSAGLMVSASRSHSSAARSSDASLAPASESRGRMGQPIPRPSVRLGLGMMWK